MKTKKKPVGRKKKIKIQPDWRWITLIFGATIGISSAMSLLSNELLSAGGMALSFCVLLFIVLIGVVFDIIGVSVTAAEEKPFHSMAAKKRPEAMIAIRLLRKADRVSSFCNDVVGDICGVVSGSAAAVIAAGIVMDSGPLLSRLIPLLLSSLVAALTVGGKAFGKSIAMQNSVQIVHAAAKFVYWFSNIPRRLFGIRKRGKRNS